mmetsp:Transcript_1359/g.1385  ORF Transcript_1359/g.1385 Transcript_1359/m.1385 type:complete len:111 (-) Transcript_1359:551-883(-)
MESKSTNLLAEEIYLSAQDAADQKDEKLISNYFICSICINIVTSPLECQECNGCFCSKCILPWIEKPTSKKQCPNCKKVFKQQKLHRSLQSQLDEIIFTCPKQCGKFSGT